MNEKVIRFILFLAVIVMLTIQNFNLIPVKLIVVINIILIVACVLEMVRERKLRKK